MPSTPPSTKLSRDEILKKVEEVEVEKAFMKRCVGAMICPECGGVLELETYFSRFHCTQCKVRISPTGYIA